jgi:hypothetical protein
MMFYVKRNFEAASNSNSVKPLPAIAHIIEALSKPG